MKSMRANRFFLCLTLTSVLLSPDCATLTRRNTQGIPVTSTPVGATVSVNGVEQGVTPVEIRLERKPKGQIIRIESPGYNPIEIRPERKLSGSVILGNFLLGIGPGFLPALIFGLGRLFDSTKATDTATALIWGLSAAAFSGGFTFIDTGVNGKGYTLKPKELIVTLTKVDGTPRVDTIFISAGDLRNVKWIRIHRD